MEELSFLLLDEMDLTQLNLESVEFPGRAGQYQREGRVTALIRELGDNYALYHAFLAAELERFGRRPRPRDYPNAERYLAAWTRIQRIVLAEAMLRNVRAYRRTRRPLDAPLDPSVPLIGEDDRLVSVE